MDAWDKIMKLAEQNGFIIWAYGGIAFLMCDEEQRERGILKECKSKTRIASLADRISKATI